MALVSALVYPLGCVWAADVQIANATEEFFVRKSPLYEER